MSKSSSPRNRLSLYLSAKLIYGAILIYKQQVCQLEDEVTAFICERPATICSFILKEIEDAEPPKKKRKSTKPRAKRAVRGAAAGEIDDGAQLQLLAEQMLHTFPEGSLNVTDAVRITLPEDVSARPAFESMPDIDLFAELRVLPVRRQSFTAMSPSRAQDPWDILADILAAVNCSDEDFLSVFKDLKDKTSISVDSNPVELTVGEVRTRTLEPVPERIEANLDVSMVPPPPPPGPEETLPQEAMLPAPEDAFMPSPRLSRINWEDESMVRALGPDVPEEPLQPPRQTEIPDVEPRIPRVHTSTPVAFDTEIKRQEVLRNYIRDLFRRNGNTPITIEDLCYPLTRRKVATTFQCLLYLHSKQYVELRCKSDSLELDLIYPGAVFLV